jgi:hypothetical protein
MVTQNTGPSAGLGAKFHLGNFLERKIMEKVQAKLGEPKKINKIKTTKYSFEFVYKLEIIWKVYL